MPGFLITNSYADIKLKNRFNSRCIQGKLMIESGSGGVFHVYRNTLNKFLDDKVFGQDNDFAIIMEGTFYNKKNLILKYGCRDFFTALKEMYLLNGDTFMNEFRGSFSGAVYDKRKGRWIVFTNHVGDKGIFYYCQNELLVIGSDVRYVTDAAHAAGIGLTLNKEAVFDMLAYEYMEREITYANEITRLTAGQYLIFEDSEINVRYYHKFNHNGYDLTDTSEKEIIEEIDRRFRYAVSLEFEKDKEYGYEHLADLSGGLDSRSTVWVAADMGYLPMLNQVYCQSNTADELIAKQIAGYWHNELLVKPLDSYSFLYDIDTLVSMNGGLQSYNCITGGDQLLNTINFERFGIEHTGQLGDAILGGTYLHKEKSLYFSSTNVRGSLKNELTDDERVKYGNDNEMYFLMTRGLKGILTTHFIRQNYTEVSSPFLDPDFLSYCYSIPPQYRNGHYIYIEWLKEKYTQAVQFKWESTGLPAKAPHWLVMAKKVITKGPKRAMTMLGIPARVSARGMNPYDYWYSHDGKLRAWMDDYLDKNISMSCFDEDTGNTVRSFFENGNSVEKMKALTVISACRFYFENSLRHCAEDDC